MSKILTHTEQNEIDMIRDKASQVMENLEVVRQDRARADILVKDLERHYSTLCATEQLLINMATGVE